MTSRALIGHPLIYFYGVQPARRTPRLGSGFSTLSSFLMVRSLARATRVPFFCSMPLMALSGFSLIMVDSFQVGSGHRTPNRSFKIEAPAETGAPRIRRKPLALGILAATLLAALAGLLGLLARILLAALTTLLATLAGLLRLLALLFVRILRIRVIHLELLFPALSA
jgi:hypothetical protein